MLIIRYFLGLFIVISIFTSHCFARTSAVTYKFSGRRLGDNLSSYINARWIAYKHNIDFLYREFKDSDKFVFHQMYKPFDIDKDLAKFATIDPFSKYKKAGKQDVLNDDIQKNDTLYILSYFHLAMDVTKAEKATMFHFMIDWNDEEFLAILRKEIASIEPLSLRDISNDKHNVAVHVRTGFQVD